MRLAAASRVTLLLLSGSLASCASGTEPSTDLSGDWGYSFTSVAAAEACPTAPADFRAGCDGAGRLSLMQADDQVAGTVVLGGSCQSCGTVADFRGSLRPVAGRWRGGELEFDIGDCRHSASVPRGMPAEVSGSVTCSFGGIVSRGSWTISRS